MTTQAHSGRGAGPHLDGDPQRATSSRMRSVRPSWPNPGFGKRFRTDHMVDICWSKGRRLASTARVSPTARPGRSGSSGPPLRPGDLRGLKAYRHADGSVWTFRPEATRRGCSARPRRLALPRAAAPSSSSTRSASWSPVDAAGCPADARRPASTCGRSCIAKEVVPGGPRRRARSAFYVIACPAGAYFPGGVRPVSIWLSTRLRARGPRRHRCRQDAAATTPRQPAAAGRGATSMAASRCCSWTSEADLEELGGMNLVLVRRDGSHPDARLGHHPGGHHPRLHPRLAARPGHPDEQRPVPHRRVARGRRLRRHRRAPSPAAPPPSWCRSGSSWAMTSRSSTRAPRPGRSPCHCARSSRTSSTGAWRIVTAG